MASGKTDYLENELLDHALRNATWTPPATIYLALYTTALTTGTWRAFGTLTPNFANHADALELQVRVAGGAGTVYVGGLAVFAP